MVRLAIALPDKPKHMVSAGLEISGSGDDADADL